MEFNAKTLKEAMYRFFKKEFDFKFLFWFIVYTMTMLFVSMMIFLSVLAIGSIMGMEEYVLKIVTVGILAWKLWLIFSLAYTLMLLGMGLYFVPRPVMQYSYDRIREISDWLFLESHVRPVEGKKEISIVNTPFLLPDGDHIRYSVTRLGKGVFIFSDDGLLKSYLTMAGKTEDEAVKIMEDFADKHGLLPSLEGHIEFCTHEGAEEFTSKYRDFMQAMIVGTELAR